VVGRRSPRECVRALERDGTYAMVGGTAPHLLQFLWLKPLLRLSSKRRALLVMHRPNREDLELLATRVETGELRPVIDHMCSLREVPEAIEQLGRGEITGKVVVAIGPRVGATAHPPG